LSRLGPSRVQYDDMLTHLQGVHFLYDAEQNALLDGYHQLYDKWMYEMWYVLYCYLYANYYLLHCCHVLLVYE